MTACGRFVNGVNGSLYLYVHFSYVTEEIVSEFELNTLLRVMPSGIIKYSADEHEEIAYINRNLYESLGYTEEQFRSKFNNCFRQMICKEDGAKAEAEISAQKIDTSIGKLDFRVEAADGNLHWFHVESVKIADKKGKLWYYAILGDITEKRKAHQRMQLSEEEFRLAVEHSGAMTCRYDIANRTLNFSLRVAKRMNLPQVCDNVPYGRVNSGHISADTVQAYTSFLKALSVAKQKTPSDTRSFNERVKGLAKRHVAGRYLEAFLNFVNTDRMLADYQHGKRTGELEYRGIVATGEMRWLRASLEMVEYPGSVFVI